MAPSQNNGDTVAAEQFDPVIIAKKHQKTRNSKHKTQNSKLTTPDSIGIYEIGPGSNRQYLQLLSYPSHRDTLTYGKTRHVRVTGSADIGRTVSVEFYVHNGKDSLVKAVKEIKL